MKRRTCVGISVYNIFVPRLEPRALGERDRNGTCNMTETTFSGLSGMLSCIGARYIISLLAQGEVIPPGEWRLQLQHHLAVAHNTDEEMM